MTFFRSERGAISVYMLLVVVPLFMFTALLIDLTRIKLAQHESETALKAGIRSVMAQYDRKLQSVGLWGLGIDSPTAVQDLGSVMSANLSESMLVGQRLIDTKLEAEGTRLTPVYSLASQLILRKQLLAAMKWRAPVEWKRTIVGKLHSPETAQPLAEGAQFGRLAEELEKLLDKRHTALDEVWINEQYLHRQLADNAAYFREQAAGLRQAATDANEPSEAADAFYERLRSAREAASRRQDGLAALERELQIALSAAEQTDERVGEKLAAAQTETAAATLGAAAVFSAVRVYGAAYFGQEQEEISRLVAMFTDGRSALGSVSADRIGGLSQAETAFAALEQANESRYSSREQIERTRKLQYDAVAKQKEQFKRSIQAVFDQAMTDIVPPGCAAVDSDGQAYRLLQNPQDGQSQGFYQKYRNLNGEDEAIGGQTAFELGRPEAFSLESLRLLQLFAQTPAELQDDVFINEFVLTAFVNRTNGFAPANRLLPAQEVEYVLYGFSGCAVNLSSAYAEMLSFRMAVRAVDALLEPKQELLQSASPVLVILAATAEAAPDAYTDMRRLTAGEAVELAGKIAPQTVRLDYSDYLRVFLLMQGGNTKVLARIQALLELNTGIDLSRSAAYVEAYAKSSVKLWFLPAIMRTLEGSVLLGCEVRGNRCAWTDSAVWSY